MRFNAIDTRHSSTKALISAGLLILAASVAGRTGQAQPAAARKTENVIVVMMDGLRWEEVFRGADPKLINKHDPKFLGATSQRTSRARELYWRDTPEQRRQALMPFLWSVMASQGQVFGNRDLGSDSHVINHHKFSYPGYS